ncbi:MAG: TraB/GumN family protein, partial [Burkholderiales bacterium]
MLKRIFLAAIIAGAAVSTGAFAQGAKSASTTPQAADSPTLLETVIVTGRVTGPGLWEVYKDGNAHNLWIMGTLNPLPANIQWDSTAVRDLISGADEVLWAPGYSVNVKANIFQQAMLGINYLRAQKNPEGKSLKEVLPPALYARWMTLKSRYMPRNSSVERKRPLVAAQELLDAAIKQAQLSDK